MRQDGSGRAAEANDPRLRAGAPSEHDDGLTFGMPEEDAAPRQRGLPWKTIGALMLLAVLGGGVLALFKTDRLTLSSLPFLAPRSGEPIPIVRAPKESLKESPLKASGETQSEVDATFQKAALWQLLKKEFPDWYADRVTETVRLKGEQKDDQVIAQGLTQALVDLRRGNAAAALAASPARLRVVAASFVNNLTRLAAMSTNACYAFISQGEISPIVVDLLRGSDITASLQGQFTAIFEAVSEGRKVPKTYAQPQREDYDVLAAQLALRGWSPADLQLFSDPRQLARAEPQRVCQMVQDWFSAQLAVKDEAVQMRLLSEALKPILSG